MSCDTGEPQRRRVALIVLGILMMVFIVLSGFSFLGSRAQATPVTVRFGKYEALEGKRVFQSYNCMGCHTIVGNGGYFGPDLTKVYAHTGPAYLSAFLPSAGSWPTEISVAVQLQDPTIAGEANATTPADYFRAFPAAKERVDRRGGSHSFMPNLPLTADDVGSLIAFLKYTSALDTEGWPPTPLADATAAAAPVETPKADVAAGAGAKVAPADPVASGRKLVASFGCLACHATDERRLVGPGWGKLYGSKVELEGGTTTTADEAYLAESITDANAKIVSGYPKGVMPDYHALVNEQQRSDIVAYLRSLGR